MEEEKSDTLIFKTQNQQLAGALLDVGCALADQKDGGPAENLYTLGFLRDRKIGVGKGIDAAVREAVARKIPGHVTYVFKRNALLERSIAVWDAMVDEMRRAEHDGVDPILPAVSDEHIVQTIYIHALNRASFLELPWFNDPCVSTVDIKSRRSVPILRDGTELPGKKEIVTGTGKVWRLNGSAAIKKKLKV